MKSQSLLVGLVVLGVLLSGYNSKGLAQACTPAPSGAIAWWPFDETSGTIAQDVIGNKPAAHFGNPVHAAGKVRGALRFDGIDDFLGTGDSDLWAFGTGNFTVEFWANFDAPGSGDIVHAGDIFIGNDEGPGSVNKWFFALGGGLLHFTVYNTAQPPSNFYLVRAPFSPVVGQWYHLAVTKNGTLFTIYVNGAAVGSEVSASPIANPNASLTIGQAESLGFMNGRLDEMTIYNRALTQAELQSIVNAGTAGKCRPLPAVTEFVSPSRGGDTGAVTVRITGNGFMEGASAKLRRAGNPDIVGNPVALSEDGTTLTTTFDLTGKARGLWDVVITNPDGTTTTLLGAFTIEEGRAAQVWVDIVGRGAIRVGVPTQFRILYGNRGNIDAGGAYISLVGIPRDAGVKTDFGLTIVPGSTSNNRAFATPIFFEAISGKVIPFLVDTVPSGFTGSLTIEITPVNTSLFELKMLMEVL